MSSILPSYIIYAMDAELELRDGINVANIEWYRFSANNNDLAVEFLLRPENRDKIWWDRFSGNNNDLAVEFLLQPENRDKISWHRFSTNNNIFKKDTYLLK